MRVPAPLAYGLSAAIHVAGLAGLARLPPPARSETVAVEIVEVAPPPPLRPQPEPELPPPRPLGLAPPRAAPQAPAPTPAPPPPNAPPPPDAPSPVRAPVRIGVSLSSTTSSGGIAAPVGNTLYGEMPKTAPAPAEVKPPYRSERYVPPTQVTVLPRPIGECRPPTDEYPDDARRLGIEGLVVLVLTVDETGALADARVVEDPGHGLGAAAVRSVRTHCRFEPARRGDETVATSFRYKVRFELP